VRFRTSGHKSEHRFAICGKDRSTPGAAERVTRQQKSQPGVSARLAKSSENEGRAIEISTSVAPYLCCLCSCRSSPKEDCSSHSVIRQVCFASAQAIPPADFRVPAAVQLA